MKSGRNRMWMCVFVAVGAGMSLGGAAHDPLSGWAQCPASATASSSRFAPLPVFIQGTVGSPVTSWPAVGTYDFCGYADTLYCQLKAINGILPVEDYADYIRCLDADLNGPPDLLAFPPLTANGILDSEYELGVLAAVLNDASHPLHASAHAAVQYNFVVVKDIMQFALQSEGYLGIMPLITPYLLGSFSMTLAGYLTLGDATTYEALDTLIEILILSMGLSIDLPDTAELAMAVPELGPEADTDGDGYTNRAEYDLLVGQLGYPAADYVLAALDPEQPAPLMVYPMSGLDSIGYESGPFDPAAKTYTLTNTSAATMNWSAAPSQSWLTVLPASGSLAVMASVEVTVNLNETAASLAPNTYAATVTFTNITMTENVARPFSLTVMPIPGVIEVSDSIAPTNDSNLPFGILLPGGSRTEQVTIHNLDATYALTISEVRFGNMASEFHFENLPTLPMSLSPGASTTFDVVYNPAVESYSESTIIIASDDADDPQTVVYLSGEARCDTGLLIAPEEAFVVEGNEGGPFSPASKTYTLINITDTPQSWSVSATENWLSLSPTAGVLPAFTSNEILATINGNATALPIGNHAATFSIANLTTGGLCAYDANLTVNLSLCESVDNCGLEWQTGGYAPWFGQSLTTHDGIDAAVNGDILAGDSSWISTRIDRPGTLSFWWKFSPGISFVHFDLLIDGILDTQVSATMDWQSKEVALGEGTHEILWIIRSDEAFPMNAGYALLDQVVFMPADTIEIRPTASFNIRGATGGPFTPATLEYTLKNTGGTALNWSATNNESWLTLSQANGALAPGASVPVLASLAAPASSLLPGSYTDTISFTNEDTLYVQHRDCQIDIGGLHVEDSIAPVLDRDMPFGDVVFGNQRTETITVQNQSAVDDITIQDIGIFERYEEDFNDGMAQDWVPKIYYSAWSVENGKFRASQLSYNYEEITMASQYTKGFYENCYFEAIVEHSSGRYGYSGLFVRADNDFSGYSGNALTVQVYSNHDFYPYYYKVESRYDYYWDVLAFETSPYIYTDGSPNRVGVRVQDNDVEVYFNGHLGWSGTDIMMSESGRIGLIVNGMPGYDYTPLACDFDDILLESGPLVDDVFSITNMPIVPLTLTPGTSYQFDIQYAPDFPGSHNRFARLISDDPVESTVDIELSGACILGTPGSVFVEDTVAPSSDQTVPFGDVPVGTYKTEQVTVSNTDSQHNLYIENIAFESVHNEDFSSGSAQGWIPANPAHWGVVAGEYRASAPQFSGMMQSLYMAKTYTDVSLEATVQFGQDSWYFPVYLIARASDDFQYSWPELSGSAYFVSMDPSGYLHVTAQENAVPGLFYSGHSNAFRSGNLPNRLRLDVFGNEISVYLNDSLCWSGTDTSISSPGRVGLGGQTEDWTPHTYYFDDIRICGDPQFYVSGLPALPAIIPPSEAITFNVFYQPTFEGQHEDWIRITSNDAIVPETLVALTGTGHEGVSPGGLQVLPIGPTNLRRELGDWISLAVTVLGAQGTLFYQWHHVLEDKTLTPVLGANDAAYTLDPIVQHDEGVYYCEVHDTTLGESAWSPPFTLEVVEQLPVAGLLGLALITVATTLMGSAALRRRK